MKMRQLFTLLAVAVFAAGTIGCTSTTKVRYGQLTTGGQIEVTKTPQFAAEKAEEGFGFRLACGYVTVGATTTHDPDANHLALGIDSSTGFDGKDDTVVTSATRVGVGPVDIGGELAFGLDRVTLRGLAKIDTGVPAVYGDHWSGATAEYEPFADVPGDLAGDMVELSGNLIFGPYGLTGALGIVNEYRPGSFECADGQISAGWGPFLLGAGTTDGKCAQGFGIGGYLGLTNESTN